jgi:hypothetical protein
MRALDSRSELRRRLTTRDGLGGEVPSLSRIALLQQARSFILSQRETTAQHAVAWLPLHASGNDICRCIPLGAIFAFNILSFHAR